MSGSVIPFSAIKERKRSNQHIQNAPSEWEREPVSRKGDESMEKTHYFRTDWNRLLKNYPIYLAVLGVALSLLFSLEGSAFGEGLVNNNAVDTYFMSINLNGQMITYTFCAVPFATVFCEDLEHKYLRYGIQRCSVTRYVLSKAGVIYLSSVIAMVLGTALFLVYVRFQVPWTSDAFQKDFYLAGMYPSLIAGGRYGVYILLSALQRGMLAGTLSLMAALLSLFITNKAVTLAAPVLTCQILLQFGGGGWLNVAIFNPSLRMEQYGSDVQYFLMMAGLSLIPAALITWGIHGKIKARL